MKPHRVFSELESKVIKANLCTHCGTCVGLSKGKLEMCSTERGPLPRKTGGDQISLDELAYSCCPGKGINFPEMNEHIFGRQPENWLIKACLLGIQMCQKSASAAHREG